MPPTAVKTIEDTIYWQYAKLISKSAGMGLNARAFQMATFQRLKKGEMRWSSTIKEWVLENEKPKECIYCGAKGDLTTEHLLPKCCGGEDILDNVIRICKNCNSKKGGKKLYEYFGHENRDKIPRIAEGKYLKLLHQLHEKAGTLKLSEKELQTELCPKCDMAKLCQKVGKEHKLNVYCLEGSFNKR